MRVDKRMAHVVVTNNNTKLKPLAKKNAAFCETLRRRYDAMLAERRKQQMLVDWQILPSEDEMSWLVADVSSPKMV